jgi:ParB family chromosome partitioning protein
VVGDKSSALLEIPIVAIRPNPHQPRTSFDEEAMAALTASIREVGVLQPVLVRTVAEDTYELIAGERRWRAARRAGLPTIPAIVRETSEAHSVEEALIENLHREDLNPLEEAGAYQQLIEDFGLTHDQLSARVGKSRVAITNTLRLFQLPPAVQKLMGEGQLTAGHARALLGTPDRAFQEALARKVVAERLSVRAVEDAVRTRNELGPSLEHVVSAEPAKLRPPGILELEELLSSHLDTRVKVNLGNRKGRVVIEFASLEDLERIYRVMTEPPAEAPS